MSGADNMALDVALMARARRTGDTVLRLYAWTRPTLSFGRNQRAAGSYEPRMLAERGIDVVRRPTGGRALLHGPEITYSVTAPVAGTLARAYGRINALLINALESLGVPANLVTAARRGAMPDATPCFAEPAVGEIVAGGRKLCGSAQWRDDGAMLQHGSILVDDKQSLVGELAGLTGSRGTPPATLRGLLGRAPSAAEFGAHLLAAVRAEEDPAAEWCTLESEVLRESARLASRFHDPSWTWRR